VTGTGTAGQVAFWNGTSSQTGDNGLFWDNTNKRLGIGTTTPATALNVKSFAQIDTYEGGTTVPNTSGFLRILSGSKTGWAPNDELGKIEFFGTDTSGIGPRNLASIRAINSQGNGTTTGSSNGELYFYTSLVGALETEKWRIRDTGILQSNGAQTIQTSTGNLTLATAAGNGNINLVPNGSGIVDIRSANESTNTQVPTLRFTDLDQSSATNQKTGRIEFFTSDIVPGPAGVTTFIESITETTLGLGALIFGTGQSGSSTERMRITSAGNLLIGTTTDSGFRLDVNGTARVQGNLTVTATNATGDFATIDASNIIRRRTAAQVLTDIGGQAALTNPVTGTGTSGQVAYFNGTTTITSESNLFWNATNDRLGIGTSSPSEDLTIQKASATSVFIGLKSNSSANQSYIGMDSGGLFQFQTNNGISFYTGSSFSRQVDIFGTGNVGINVAGTDAGFKLDVNGTGRFSSSVTATELYLSTSSGLVGNINSSNANGGYLTWQTSGTTIADIGTAQQIFGAGGNDTFGINGRGARAIAFGTNNIERMRITSDGNVLIGTTTNGASKLRIVGLPTSSVGLSSGDVWSDLGTLKIA
jgi:hypothetical protein